MQDDNREVEYLNKIIELGQPNIVTVHDRPYSTRELKSILEPVATPLQFNSLTGLVTYFSRNIDKIPEDSPPAFHVVSEAQVDLLSGHIGCHFRRHLYGRARAPELEGWQWGTWHDQESFIIALQSLFLPTEHQVQLLILVSKITGDEIRTSADDGISQELTAKAGVHMSDRVIMPNPILLRPYRTFREIAQPASPFVLRARVAGGRPQLALFEADGGVWKLEAMTEISALVREMLPDPLKDTPILA